MWLTVLVCRYQKLEEVVGQKENESQKVSACSRSNARVALDISVIRKYSGVEFQRFLLVAGSARRSSARCRRRSRSRRASWTTCRRSSTRSRRASTLPTSESTRWARREAHSERIPLFLKSSLRAQYSSAAHVLLVLYCSVQYLPVLLSNVFVPNLCGTIIGERVRFVRIALKF